MITAMTSWISGMWTHDLNVIFIIQNMARTSYPTCISMHIICCDEDVILPFSECQFHCYHLCHCTLKVSSEFSHLRVSPLRFRSIKHQVDFSYVVFFSSRRTFRPCSIFDRLTSSLASARNAAQYTFHSGCQPRAVSMAREPETGT